METKLISFGVPPRNNTDALVIRTKSKTTVLTITERDSDNTEDSVQTRVRDRIPGGEGSELFTHKNRDGSFAYAMGKEPTVWPEDER
jgi:hypothetical protein